MTAPILTRRGKVIAATDVLYSEDRCAVTLVYAPDAELPEVPTIARQLADAGWIMRGYDWSEAAQLVKAVRE